jgi:CheY-like chemotaxis protein/HAMP domain-containing protein
MRQIADFFTATIQRKILSSFAAVIVLVLAMVIAFFYQLNQVRSSAAQVVPDSAQTGYLQDFALALSSLEANLERLFVIGGVQFKDDILQDLETMTGALELMKKNEGEKVSPTIQELEQTTQALKSEVLALLDKDLTKLSVREANQTTVSINTQTDHIKQLYRTLSLEIVNQLQDVARQQEIITSNVITQSLVLGILVTLLVVVASAVVTRSIATPLTGLAKTATQIAGGDLSAQAPITTKDEVGQLATAFNSMTDQLRNLINNLEDRIADRTRRLAIVATLGEQLNAILDPNELLNEVVNQIKKNFSYYHSHIYLFDDARENLVVAAGVGAAGKAMQASGHHINLQAATSLVARAARSGEIVRVDDVQQVEDWLPNPLLPDTQAEVAVPIIQKGMVIGVLDVQENRVSGLDENDANLLRSLANQIAVALGNARLFEQTTRAKEEAEQAKEEANQARDEAEQAKEDIEIANKALETQVWQTTGHTLLNECMRGEQDIPTLAQNIIQQVCKYLGAQVGAMYELNSNMLKLVGGYAYSLPAHKPGQFKLGEGLVGQAAFEKQSILVGNIPQDHLTVTSGLVETSPRHILVSPFVYDARVAGVIEIGALAEFTPAQLEFLNKARESIAIAFTTAQARARINELLAETQTQAEELQVQEEELRAANEELESQTESLRTSETKLKANQAELEATNAELEEKADALQQQQTLLDQQNQELKAAQQELQRKAEELALASKYKSEFLANMSHELRTPLNSLLILAGMLVKNEQGNLTPDQVESAQIIKGGGTDLLNLINDILDLSKVEAGKVEFRLAPMPLDRLISTMRAQFAHVAESKGLAFDITLADDAPDIIETDQQRVEQIIKNLLSNAFKFTTQGSVRLNIARPQPGVNLSKSGLKAGEAIAFSVSDTGIGMTPEQQKIVFEAFQQADGSTSRQYGGTGLGLSISRELALRLGGQIDLTSEKDKGSAFTLYLPIGQPAPAGQKPASPPAATASRPDHQPVVKPTPAPAHIPQPAVPSLPDDRDKLQANDRLLLIIEDDPKFAKVVYDYAHKKGFKCLLAGDGQTGLHLAQTYKANAIILDLNLPGLTGWEVLDALKNDPSTRHLPVHIMSVSDENLNAYKHGAMGFLSKPISQEDLDVSFQKIEQFITRKIKTLLLVEDDESLRKSVRKLLEGNDVAITEAGLGQVVLEQLATHHFDCMILDLSLPDMSGFEVLSRLDADESLSKCPVIVYTGQALTEEENRELLKYADSVIVKGVKSPERLLDETALFLHRVIADMPEEKQRAIRQLHDQEAVLAGKSILIVDDDARNAFALSKLLADKDLEVYIAVNGQKALELLDKTPIDLVLMDIMMPGMDGYEVTRRIRAQHKFRVLPVLALTAKAMVGDREKCIEAGANDYLSKPIDADRLFSMLRVWLSRE